MFCNVYYVFYEFGCWLCVIVSKCALCNFFFVYLFSVFHVDAKVKAKMMLVTATINKSVALLTK